MNEAHIHEHYSPIKTPKQLITVGIMAVWLAIALAYSYAAGESTWEDLRPWCLALLCLAGLYAAFRLWSIFRGRHRRGKGPN